MDIVNEEEEEIEKNFEEELSKMNSPIIQESEITKECRIGEGSFGKVYKGTFKGNSVAIKKIKLKEKTQEVYASLLNEIKVIKKADTPEIPKFYGIMKRKGNYHLIFEFVCGKTFKEINPILNYEKKLVAFCQLCSILEKFHSKLLIHRDIKPSNVMIKDDGSVKLIDFGETKIAKHTLTHTMAQKGTVKYMPPEQFNIDIDAYENLDCDTNELKPVPISTKSDIWSLGVMISEMFSGVSPYSNISTDFWLDENFIINYLMDQNPFPIPDTLNNDIKEIVRRATEIDIEKRATSSEIKILFQNLIKKLKENEAK